jgi:hypothetical protein
MSKSNRPARSTKSALPSGYGAVLVEVKRMIGDARRRALASVNRELVRLYWEIGRVIVAQQEKAAWARRSWSGCPPNRPRPSFQNPFSSFPGLTTL